MQAYASIAPSPDERIASDAGHADRETLHAIANAALDGES